LKPCNIEISGISNNGMTTQEDAAEWTSGRRSIAASGFMSAPARWPQTPWLPIAHQHQTSVVFTSLARLNSWFGNPAVVLEQEIRGFAASPHGECAGSSDHVWSASTVTTRQERATAMLHKQTGNIAFAICITRMAT